MKSNIFSRVSKVMFTKGYRKITYPTLFLILILLPFSFPVSIFLAFAYLGYIDTKLHKRFMKDFAKKHELKYQRGMNEKTLSARLFKIGHSRNGTNVIFGDYKNFPFRLFNYSYTVGSGKNSRTYPFTVCEVTIKDIEFPHIFLKSDSMRRHGSQDLLGQNKDVRIRLSKEIEESFDLYCTQDYEIEVLQIFTPKILRILKDKASKISIEFAGDKIYFYDDYCMRSEEDLNVLLNVVNKIMKNSGDLIQRLKDDFESMHEVYKKTASR